MSLKPVIGGKGFYLDRAGTGTPGALLAANNLSDLADVATARGNLGLGAAALLGASAGGNGLADSGLVAVFGAAGNIFASNSVGCYEPISGAVGYLYPQGFEFSNLTGGGNATVDFSAITGARAFLFPDASGTIALLSDIPAAPSSIVGITGTMAEFNTACTDGDFGFLGAANAWTAANTFSVNGAASTPAAKLTGTWFTGGTSTTTKPQFLIEPTGTTSAGWSTSGTGLGINAPSGFLGKPLDIQLAGTSKVYVDSNGALYAAGRFGLGAPTLHLAPVANGIGFQASGSNGIEFIAASNNPASVLAGGAGNTLQLASTATLSWTSSASATNTSNGDTALIRGGAAAVLQMGRDVNGAAIAQHFKAHNRITTDGAGADLTLSGGNGRGGAGGSLILSTYTTGAAATAGTLTPHLTIDTAGVIAWNSLAPSADAALPSTHSVRMTFNGTEYKVLLATP